MKQYKNISPWFDHWTGEVNAAFVSSLTMASNWLAPIPEAAMTGNAIMTIFDLPPWLAFIVAASIEIAGFGVNSYYLEAQAFNETQQAYQRRHNAKDTKLPLEDAQGAGVMVIAYYIVTGCVVAFNAIYQVATKVAPPIMLLAILFPVVSALATVAANRRAALHRKIINGNETEVKVAKSLQDNSETVAQPEPEPAQPKPEPVQLNDRQIAIAETLAKQPEITYTRLGKLFGVSRTTAAKDVRQVKLAGKLGSNGHGMEAE
jgi:hypothetical protein